MKIDEALALVRRCAERMVLRNSAIPIGKTTVTADGDSIRIVTDIRVPDRETGEEKWLFHAVSLERGLCARGETYVFGELRRHYCGIFEHEFREAFHLDGRRVLDPHHEVGDFFDGVRIAGAKATGPYSKRLTLEDGRLVDV